MIFLQHRSRKAQSDGHAERMEKVLSAATRAAVVWRVCWRTAFKNSVASLMTVLYGTAEMLSGKRQKLERDHSDNKPQGSEYLGAFCVTVR